MGICCSEESIPLVENDAMLEEYTLDKETFSAQQQHLCATQYDFERGRAPCCGEFELHLDPNQTGDGATPNGPKKEEDDVLESPPAMDVIERHSDHSELLYSPSEGSLADSLAGGEIEPAMGRIVVYSRDLHIAPPTLGNPRRAGAEDAEEIPASETARHVECTLLNSPILLVEIPRTEQLGVTAMNIELTVKPKNEGKWHEVRPKSKPLIEKNTWDFLSLPDAVKELNEGNTLYRFMCKTPLDMVDADIEVVRQVINLSCFENEEMQNNVKRYNVDRDDEEFRKLRLIVAKTMYLLPGVRMEDISVERLCTVDYQRRCQPGKPKIWDDVTEPDVFRFTKSLIPLIFSMTVQFKVWEMDEKGRQSVRGFDGQVPTRAVVMERTKRDISKVDSVVKMRNVLWYYDVPGGILASMVTLLVNTSLPKVIASIINRLGSSGANEAAQTTDMTRGYFLKHLGDCRPNRVHLEMLEESVRPDD